MEDNFLTKLKISRNEDSFLPDAAAKGAQSRWLQTDSARLRVLSLPPGFEGDHVCYKGHSIYMISGECILEIGDLQVTWKEGDAYIIPNQIPHRLINSGTVRTEMVIFD